MIAAKYLHLPWLLHNERRAPEALRRLQERKLRRLVAHAYENVPFYRERFRALGLRPEDIATVEDLEKLPIIDKTDLRSAGPGAVIDRRVKDTRSLITIRTSGSTGRPFAFFVSPEHDQVRKAQFLRPYLSNGRRVTDRVLRISMFAPPRPTWFQRLRLLPEHRVPSDAPVDAMVEALVRVRPQVIIGYAMPLAFMARHIIEETVAIDPPRLIFSDSELLTPEMRRTIERAFGTAPIDVYGTFETDNIAYECSAHAGYHMALDCAIMEFVKDGRRAEPGEEGEVVCTVLDNFAMPFIRYNVHDLASCADESCPCGRTFPLMRLIGGRTDDCIVDRDGAARSAVPIVDVLTRLADDVREFQIVQEAPGELAVLVVPSHRFSGATVDAIRTALAARVPGARIDIQLVERIARTAAGKFKAFVSKVKARSHGR